MYLFCPVCGNLLVVEEGPQSYRFGCNTCPYIQDIDRKVSSMINVLLLLVHGLIVGVSATYIHVSVFC